MPSPFPGMDPFLEQDSVWPTFHYHLVNTLFQVVVPGLLERYRARVAERTYVVEQVLFTSVQTEDHREPFLEVRTRGDGKLVTLLEVISPTNKCTAAGRQAYRDRRQDAIRNKANVVEIDLVLQGASVHDFSRESLPAWDYSVVVSARLGRNNMNCTPRRSTSGCRAFACRSLRTTATRWSTCKPWSIASMSRVISTSGSIINAVPPSP